MTKSELHMSDTKISIITPVYNAEKFISETIQSVQSQTHVNWEMLITDDRSTDNSVSIITQHIQDDPRIKLSVLPQNSGSAIARNLSIENATGEVIAFLDADDIWDREFLEKSLSFMEDNSAAIVFSSYRRLSEDLSKDLGEFVVPQFTDYKKMLKSCVISCLTGMYHVKRCNGKAYMPDLKKAQDYCLWLDLLKHTDRAFGNPEILATYRICKSSLSRNKVDKIRYQWKVYREIEKLPLILSGYYLIHYIIRGVIKNHSIIQFRTQN